MVDEERPFVITVRHRWTLWILPAIATLYFLAIILLNALGYKVQGVSEEMLVYGGLAIFVVVILVELPFLMRRKPKRAPKAARAAAPVAAGTAAPAPLGWDDELLTTSESQQGLAVVEYSAPAKSSNPNAVYTKTYVPVTPAHVVRVETLVADQSDL